MLLLLQAFVDVVKPQVILFHDDMHTSVFKTLHQSQGVMKGLIDVAAEGVGCEGFLG